MKGNSSGIVPTNMGTVAETVPKIHTPTAMVPMLYKEERSAARKAVREYEMVSYYTIINE